MVWSAGGPAMVPVLLLCRSHVGCLLPVSPQASASKEQESSAPQVPSVTNRSSSATSPTKPSRRASKASCRQGQDSSFRGARLRPTAQGPQHSTAPRRQAPADLTHPVALLSRGRECGQPPVPEAALGPPLGPQHRLLCSLQLQLEVQGAWAEGSIEESAPVPRLAAALHSPRCPVLHPTGTLHSSAIPRLEHPGEDAKGHVPICGPARRYQKVRQRGVVAGSWP